VKKKDTQKLSDLANAIIVVASQMANLCFNLSQRSNEPLSERNAIVMKQLQAEYDHALGAYRNEQRRIEADQPKRKTTKRT
jgi:hypothetical protein